MFSFFSRCRSRRFTRDSQIDQPSPVVELTKAVIEGNVSQIKQIIRKSKVKIYDFAKGPYEDCSPAPSYDNDDARDISIIRRDSTTLIELAFDLYQDTTFSQLSSHHVAFEYKDLLKANIDKRQRLHCLVIMVCEQIEKKGIKSLNRPAILSVCASLFNEALLFENSQIKIRNRLIRTINKEKRNMKKASFPTLWGSKLGLSIFPELTPLPYEIRQAILGYSLSDEINFFLPAKKQQQSSTTIETSSKENSSDNNSLRSIRII
jgi:hypothetical protein